MKRPSNIRRASGARRSVALWTGNPSPPAWRAAALPAAATLALVLAGCSSAEEPAPAASPGGPSGTASSAPSDPGYAKEDLFRAEGPVSVEAYFQTQPQLRPVNGTIVLEQSATGPGTFEVPAMAPGSTFQTFLTCNRPEAYDIRFLDAAGGPVTSTGGDSCNSGNLASYEYPVTPDGIPASVTVSGVNAADYWIVVYNIVDPE